MISFTWLQSRSQTLVAAIALAVAAIALAVTGSHLAHLYDTTVARCAASGDCQAATQAFQGSDHGLQIGLNVLIVVVPALVGLFWGAPLVARDLEEGTFRLAWTQSVTRARWLAVRLALTGLATTAVAGLFSLMVTWWYSPLDRLSGSPFASFGSRDLVPVGYALFAFALGVTVGVLVRRTLPALAISLAAFVAVRLAITYWVRPGLFTPAHQDLALNPSTTGYGYEGFLLFSSQQSSLEPASPNIPGAWITSVQIVDKSGQPLSNQFLASACPGIGGGGGPGGGSGGPGNNHSQVSASTQQGLQDCVTRVGKTYHEVVSYQPASRYWPFQWSELAIYLGIAVLLAGFCVWRIRRHPG
jgi:ABC-type transport system involved in multi-copper enzyme maturation permease subunit